MKRFLTLFPKCENIHLIKDVGMIPFVMHKELKYESTLACYKNGDYPYLNSEVSGLKMVFIPKIFNNSTLDSCVFLLFNLKKYDILQCYHFSRQSLLILTFFKWMKKIFFSSSFTFLKLDADDDILNLKVKWQHHLFINSINLITAETKNIYASLNKMYTLQKEVAYLPNGFYGNGLKKDVDYGSKENLIITVGRIGTFQKNNEILLEAFREFALLNTTWRLEIIGPIEKDFEPYITQYFKLNPFLKDRVLFTGSITDRIQLEDKYTKAKIFVLTSRFESFGLVYLEAMKSACIIISTAITPAYDITDNGRFGSLFPIGDFKSLAALLLQTVNDSQKLEEDCKLIQDFAYENFTWTKICQGLNKLIH